MLILDKNLKFELDSRIVSDSDKILLIFANKQLMEWTKRWFMGRDDIIYMTEDEICRHGLYGIRYNEYKFADEETLIKLKGVLDDGNNR